ncbi:photosynthetic complex assembly protein PuhC [Limnohabitans sp. JirII-29]|uniref:photosynthetic complex assembly protein PuhC n=1 Tax=Limnohabitans sp. JirII-29 TaxID=1835756 RepID=UPI000D3AA9CC|nr:photosynthetic complex assembly protein PuhC [Limnohabitans sp. JirII-29]PUE30215.1 photosynthetic complex assembly protein PuhC [Limnohabitans sp. JirII-29]
MSTLHNDHWSQHNHGLSRPMAWIGVVLLAVLVAVGLARWSGLDPRTPDAAVQWQRALQFSDLPNGDIAVLDADTQKRVARFSGEQGFLRSTLRALARERHREKIGPEAPLLLMGRTDGRLTLLDPTTQQRIDLESFGPSNAAVFAGLRLAGHDTPIR